VSGLASANFADISTVMIWYNFCVLPALFCNKIIHIWNFENHIYVVVGYAPSELASSAGHLVLQTLQF
jgi:hypothetical protein